MCMYMCPCLCSYVCTNVRKCVYTCINVNMSVESMNNFRSCTSGAIRLVCFLKQSCSWFEDHHFSWSGWPRIPGDLRVSLSLPPQDWDCKCASPGLALPCLGSGDPAQVFAFVWQTLHRSLFVLCGFCFAFVFGLAGWFCCHCLFVRFWDYRCAPPHQASAAEIRPH